MRARLPRRGECRGDGAHRPVCGAIPRAACAPPLAELCETLDTAGVLRRQAEQIAALDATVAELRARLDDHLQRQAL